MNSNLDVWAVQDDPRELYTAMDQIKEGLSIIYSNCICDFSVGGHSILSRRFDTVLYNEESDVLILLMKSGEATKKDMISYLEEKNKRYAEITFSRPDELYYSDTSSKEIWFARDGSVLEDAIGDSISKDIPTCEFYPMVEGTMSFNYMTSFDEKFSIDGRIFKGVVAFDDKVILIINQKDHVDALGNDHTLSLGKVLRILEDKGVGCNISFDTTMNLEIENKRNKTI